MPSKNASTPIILLSAKAFKGWLAKQPVATQRWIEANHFTATAGLHCFIPATKGDFSSVVIGVKETIDYWSIAMLPEALPAGTYHIEGNIKANDADALMLGWLLGSYHFSRYKKPSKTFARLTPPAGCNIKNVQLIADAISQARDLITTPANDMGPEELAAVAKQLAKQYRAHYSEIIGEDLLSKNYPAIYEVGKASTRAPRLVDIRWGNKKHPKVTLVGKGVCFDSGGLDIKPSSGMRMMKKDMGGAACVLALARIIMGSGLKVCLRVLIPAVENSISGNAYRPMDVIKTRKGMSVEIGNTDAEGRIILCDALYEADSENPDLLIDCATLTGAARTALGTDIPAFFTSDETLAAGLTQYAFAQDDPLWRLPLWEGYREMLKSTVADINSAPDSGYGGAITAALYLKEFVKPSTAWAHIDMMAWNLKSRPGRPIGGEAMAVRALFALIQDKFQAK